MQTEFGSTIGSFSAEGRKTFIASREIAGLTVDRISGNADERGEKFMWLEQCKTMSSTMSMAWAE